MGSLVVRELVVILSLEVYIEGVRAFFMILVNYHRILCVCAHTDTF